MQRLVMIMLLLSLPLLFSCQNNKGYHYHSEISANSLYLTDNFVKPASFTLESEQDIFMLDDEMRAMVENKVNNALDIRERAAKLLKHLIWAMPHQNGTQY